MTNYAQLWEETLRSGSLLSSEEALLDVLRHPPTRVQTLNVDHLYLAGHSDDMRKAIRESDFVTADGWPLVSYAHRVGLRSTRRVTGKWLCRALVDGRLRTPYVLLGTTGEVCSKFEERARSHGSERLGCRHGSWERFRVADLANQIDGLGECLVLVALGAPKGEVLAAGLRRRVANASLIGVGGGIDMAVEAMPSAPSAFENARLEWLYRLAHEPRRLGKRYLAHDLRVMMSLSAHALAGDHAMR